MVGAGAQEGGPAAQGAVAGGHCAQFPLDFQFRQGLREVQGRVAEGVGNVVEKVVNGGEAEGGQHFGLFRFGVRYIVGLKMGGGQGSYS